MLNKKPILEVRNLTKVYGKSHAKTLEDTGPQAGTNICPHSGAIVALNNVSFTLYDHEILGIMGESGSGKSTLLKIIYGLDTADAGEIIFHHEGQAIPLLNLNAGEYRRFRDQNIGMVHQNPRLGLNFNISAGGNIAERILMGGRKHYAHIRHRAKELLLRTQVPVDRIDESPAGFSGGMQQRVQIAKALAVNSPLLLLDEVTTGLDLSVQARILDLILELYHELKLAMLSVSHDIGVVRTLSSQTLIMRYGSVVEAGLTDQIMEDPQHPYSQELINAAL